MIIIRLASRVMFPVECFDARRPSKLAMDVLGPF